VPIPLVGRPVTGARPLGRILAAVVVATFVATVPVPTGAAGWASATAVADAVVADVALGAGSGSPATVTAASGGSGVGAALATSWLTVTRFCLLCPESPPAGTEVTYLVVPNDSIQGVPWTTYTGTVTFASTDPRAILPKPYTFTGGAPGADQGEHYFTVVYRTSGPQTLTVSSTTPVKMSGIADPVEVAPAASHHLTIDATPKDAVVGKPFSPQPVVRVRDEYGNVTDSSATITLSLETPPEGAGALFTCADGIQRKAKSGIARWDGCTIGRAANGYRIRADADGLTSARTDYFIVSYPTGGPPTPTGSPGPTATPGPSASPGPTATPGPTTPPGPSPSLPPDVGSPRLTRSPATVTYPAAVTLALWFPGAGAGRTLAIERRNADASEWTRVGDVTTDVDGRASLDVVPGRTAEYRAVWPGSADLPAATSRPVTATVRFGLKVSPAFTTRSVTWGTTLTWSVKVQPRTTNVAVTFRLYQWTAGKWKLYSTVVKRTPSTGLVTYARRFWIPGRWAVAIVTGRGTANAPATAPRIVVTVR
jgi:hypothetical protein